MKVSSKSVFLFVILYLTSSHSRPRSAAFTQTAALDTDTQDGTAELPGYLAPLSSHLADSASTDQRNSKRKRQSSSQQTPSTSSRRPAKRSRRDLYLKGPLLGRGGFGSGFAGVRRSDGLPVDIKYMSKDRTPETLKVDGQGRLPLEVALKTHITLAPACPSVLQLLDWFDSPRRYVLILERLAPCQDLQSFCEENGCLDERLVKELHQDVKPENLLISRVPGHQAAGLRLWRSAEALGLQILCRHSCIRSS
ncbi:serine/threonine-protein kinase pim-2-like [Danio rerio]|uniref:Serine/threonine-protein kinase pim-2-like n=1 Tax=Danio rerio TaxID=7955 RepID=A0AC58GLD3_DANRE